MADHDNPDLPPQDIAAERALLGAMLLSPTAITDTTTLTPTDFYHPAHELIHAAITHLHAASQPVDALTVADHLTKQGNLDRAGGRPYLHDLVAAVPTAANATYYAHIVTEKAVLRRLREAATRITASTTLTGDTPLDDLLNDAEQQIHTVVANHHLTDDIPDPATAVYDAIAELDTPPGTPTPWQYLTNTIAGWKPATLYLIGARPGIGKSVAGLDIALDTARRGPAACFYSLEMSRTELYHRLFANTANVPMDRIQHRRLTDTDHTAISEAGAHLANLPLHVDDRAALSLAQIRASITARQREHEVGAIIIDYLQLIAPPPGTPRDDRRVQVDAISRGLKALAKDTGLPVIALTQLNRGPEARADKTPTLADLREAGGQEQDADVVILLHRDLKGDEPNVLHMGVAKNRHGPLNRFELRFDGSHARITDSPWNTRPPVAERPAS